MSGFAVHLSLIHTMYNNSEYVNSRLLEVPNIIQGASISDLTPKEEGEVKNGKWKIGVMSFMIGP